MPARKNQTETTPAQRPEKSRSRSAVVRKITQGTLLALTLSSTQFGGDPGNPDWRVFDPGMVDRLQMPLTRYHE